MGCVPSDAMALLGGTLSLCQRCLLVLLCAAVTLKALSEIWPGLHGNGEKQWMHRKSPKMDGTQRVK